MLASAPWKALTEYYEPDYYKGDILYEAPTSVPHTVYCWKAHHRATQELFVFKAIHRSQIDNLNEELNLMGRLKRIKHKNLVKVYDVIHKDGSDWVFYKMEYCEGEFLRYYLRGEPLGLERCIKIIKCIITGLQFLHNAGLIHRDLKPDNIFFLKDGTPKIGDYGLIKSKKWLTYISSAGTRDYLAPEMKHGASANLVARRGPRSDIYSVGVILWEMITGQSPPIPKICPDCIVENKWKVMLKSTAVDPAKRYATAEKLLDDIGNLIDWLPKLTL